MNTFAYLIYLFLTYLITVHVGLRFYRNGRLYILRLFKGEEGLTDFVNRMLLVGYYLLNLGYAALMLTQWRTLHTWTDVIASVGSMIGRILLTLAVIHYLNMAVILLVSTRHHRFVNHKN